MPNKIKIQFQGKDAWAEIVGVQSSQENWNQYFLIDGTLLKFKAVVVDILRIEGEYDNEGNPVYVVKSSNIVSINAPDTLRKR